MLKIRTLSVLLFAVCLCGKAAAQEKMVINVAAIDWCPQICPKQQDKPGYIVEIAEKVFENTDYQLNIDYFPWSRAIRYVNEGKYLALLSPAKSEAPLLNYPQYPIGIQQMCFFVLDNSSWRYTGVESLAGRRVGIATDTSIEELNSYIKTNPAQFQFQPYHERYVAQNINKMIKGRIDTFLFTRNTTLHTVKTNQLADIHEAGCVSAAPVYMAFSPQSKQSEQAAKVFDHQLLSISQHAEIDKILKKYDVGFSANRLVSIK